MKWLKNIWNFDRWTIKITLLVIFIFITGFPQAIVRHAAEEQKNLRPVEDRMAERELTLFMMAKVEAAEEKISKGIPYGPYDYFEDLWQFHLKCQQLQTKQSSTPEINQLGWFMQCSMIEKKYKESDLNKARDRYKELIDPGRIPREELAKSAKSFGLNNILIWLFWLYLKTLPLVLILYLVWAKDEAGYKNFLMPKPLRFFVLLILYPFVIGYCICRSIRESERRISAEAELRRSKKLFAYVTEEEQERIRQFAKSSLSLKEWRKQLADMGLKPRHSFAAALTVTLLFMVVIRPAEACAKQAKDFAGNATLEQIATSQNIARMSIDAKKIQPEKSSWSWEKMGNDLAVDSCDCAFFLRCRWLVQKNIFAPLTEFFRKIFHIPLLAVGFEANIVVQPQS